MSSFQTKHDDALLASPWKHKADDRGHVWLFKHAHHPDKAGYVFIATDLQSVLFESLTAPSVPSRLAALEEVSHMRRPRASHSTSDTNVEDIANMIESTLDKVAGLMGDWWDEVTLQVQEDDFYDRNILLSAEDFTWIFKLTELKDRTPLAFISRHLILPLSSLVAASHGVSIPRGSGSAAVLAKLLSEDGWAEDLASAVKAGPSRPTASRAAKKARTIKAAGNDEHNGHAEDQDQEDVDDQGQAYLDDQENQHRSGLRSQDSETARSIDPTPTLRDETPLQASTPSPPPTPLGQSPRPVRPPSPPSDAHEEASESERQKSATPLPVAAAKSPSKPKDKDKDKVKAKAEASPVKEPPASQRPSQKSRKEKEQEEEDEMKMRMEAMKAKMGKGGGSKLGKRRLAR